FSEIGSEMTKISALITDDMSFANEHKELYDKVKEEYDRISNMISDRREGLTVKMMGISVLYTSRGALSDTEEKSVEDALKAMDEAEELMKGFVAGEWDRYNKFFNDNNITLDRLIKL
ncbi:MAG: hypothetical protein LC649_02975, partial [Bacteroidales bacterium]|nr:hypothetical protein [Bacteroidales bacterium]